MKFIERLIARFFIFVLLVFGCLEVGQCGEWKFYKNKDYRFRIESPVPLLEKNFENEKDLVAFSNDPKSGKCNVLIILSVNKFKKETVPDLGEIPHKFLETLKRACGDCGEFKMRTVPNKYKERGALLSYVYYRRSMDGEYLATEIDFLKNYTWYGLFVSRPLSDRNADRECERILRSFEVF